ncbi:hypothetical protein NMY22_g7272 [Coprinellus aureogranulatus]|nr:hypothetical protein NMY22_g7272 [Coprinellus aureogranulatus]
MEASLPVFCEHWESVIEWMKHLAFFNGRQREQRGYMEVCTTIMTIMVAGAKDCPHRRDIMTRDATQDLIIMLMIQRHDGSASGKHVNVLENAPGMPCMIIELFFKCPTEWIANRLKSISKQARRAVIYSLIQRGTERMRYQDQRRVRGSPSQMEAWELSATIKNTRLLSLSVLGLSVQDLRVSIPRKRFLSTFSQEILSLSNLALTARPTELPEECWETLGICGRTIVSYAVDHNHNPTHAIVDLLEDGSFLRTPWVTIYQRTTPGARHYLLTTLEHILPFLYLPQVFNAFDSFTAAGGTPWWVKPTVNTSGDPLARACLNWATMLDLSRTTYRKRSHRSVSLCMNSKHSLHASEQPEIRSKKCARCRQVFYCSSRCQKEHWQIHRMDCVLLSKETREQRHNGTRASTEMRWDQLRIVDTLVNSRLVPPFLWNRWNTRATRESFCRGVPLGSPHPPECRCDDHILILMVDFYFMNQGDIIFDVVPLRSRFADPWSSAALEPYRPRLRRWISDIVDSPRRLMLLEGMFRISSGLGVSLYAVVEYVSQAPEGEWYTPIDSFLIPFPKSIL